MSNKKEEYSESLKDPRWQKKRYDILIRDDWTCQICGAKSKTLHVHHNIYEKGKKPWEYSDYQLITLCRDCHEYEHELFDRTISCINDLRRQGLTFYEIIGLLEELSFKLSYDSYVIRDFCFGLNSEGKPFTHVLKLESLAKRRESVKNCNI